MSIAAAIAAKDGRELRRDRRLVIMVLLVLILGLTAVATAFTRITAYEADRAATVVRDRQTWEGQGERNPHSAAHFATWALRPLTAGALLDPGISAYAGSAIWMEAHNQNPARARPVEDRVTTLAAGEFSLAWVLQMLMPLLIAVIAAGAVARERERGTLRLILASGASPMRFVTAKLASVGRMAAMIAGGTMVLGGGAALMAGSADIASLLLWALAYALFLAIVVMVAVGVSVRARSTGQALLILVGIWLFAVVLVPRAAASATEIIAPTPPADQFWTRMSAAMEAQPDPFGDDAEAFGQAMARRYGVARVEDLPVDFGGLQLEESERLGNIVFDRFFGELNALYAQQRAILRWGNLLSPLPALQNISMALAGTDMPHQLAFQEQAERHRRAMVTQLNTDLINNGREAGFDYKAGPEVWQQVKDFRFAPPPAASVWRSIWIDALILLAWLALAAWFARRGASRLLAAEA